MAGQEAAAREHKRLFLQRLEEELNKQGDADEVGRSQFLSGDKHANILEVCEQWVLWIQQEGRGFNSRRASVGRTPGSKSTPLSQLEPRTF